MKPIQTTDYRRLFLLPDLAMQLDPRQEPCRLSLKMGRSRFERAFGPLYRNEGGLTLPLGKMVGLLIRKQLHDLSGYAQLFCCESKSQWGAGQRFRHRAAIEPKIGYVNSTFDLVRSYLRGISFHPRFIMRRLFPLILAAALWPSLRAFAADTPSSGTQVFFDDFSYTNPYEMEAHGWTVRTKPGWPGIENAIWKKENVSFPPDPSNPAKRILRMTSSTDGTPANTFQTQICQQRKFLEGTYVARVHFANGPAAGPPGDGVVQSFYTYSTVGIPNNPNYSECDFEYLPEGGWGQKDPALFVTTWRTAGLGPNEASENMYNIIPGTRGGWHVLMFQVADGHVRYFLDGSMIADHSGRYYPREIMSFNFNLWFTREGVGPSRQVRSYEENIDWVYFEKGAVLSPGEVEQRVQALRKAGVPWKDTVESMGLPCPCNS